MRKITYADRFRYAFDNTMSQGVIALIGWLFILSVVLIAVSSLLVTFAGAAPVREDGTAYGFFEVAWIGFMHTLDSGAIGGDDIGSGFFLVAMMLVTFGGIFIFSTLIGVLTSGIESKLDDLRKGRSFVVEHDHNVILGWSPQIFAIISELMIANASRPKSCIVILAEKDKVEMEDEIRNHVGNTGKMRIVCRTGSPINLDDLGIVNPDGSRSIIILSQEADDPDSHVIKTLLALVNNPNRRPQPYHIVAEIRDSQNLEVAQMIAKNEAKLILVADLISRIAVQTCRQSGLSVLYTELLDFGGDEIYFKEIPQLTGKLFGEALVAFEKSSVIGLRTKDGQILLNPPRERKIAAGDSIICISEDDSLITLASTPAPAPDMSAIRTSRQVVNTPERTLILGWNSRGVTIINELDSYVAMGSEVTVVADLPEAQFEIERECSGVCNQKVTFLSGSTTDRRTLDSLNVTGYDHVITLSYSDTLPAQEADARTLITLLHLRDIQVKTGKDVSIVSEMLDMRNRELADVTRADDFIVSDKLISLMLSQVSENPDLMGVFEDLFDPEGAEFYLKPAEDYVALNKTINVYTLVEAGLCYGEMVVGYRRAAEAEDPDKRYGMHINPRKSDTVSFAPGDRVIVLASG